MATNGSISSASQYSLSPFPAPTTTTVNGTPNTTRATSINSNDGEEVAHVQNFWSRYDYLKTQGAMTNLLIEVCTAFISLLATEHTSEHTAARCDGLVATLADFSRKRLGAPIRGCRSHSAGCHHSIPDPLPQAPTVCARTRGHGRLCRVLQDGCGDSQEPSTISARLDGAYLPCILDGGGADSCMCRMPTRSCLSSSMEMA